MQDITLYHEKLLNLNHINNESLVLDLGANIGDITDLIYQRYAPNIHCFEPNISCCKYMQKRFKVINKIHIYNLAVSNFTGKASLFFHKHSKNISEYNQRSSLKPDKDGLDVKKKIEVNCIHIKEILDRYNKIDLIKIDIEGSEYEIMPEIIKNRHKVNMVICETHGNPKGKKIPNFDGTKLEIKNKAWTDKHKKLMLDLDKSNLYGSWFHEWY